MPKQPTAVLRSREFQDETARILGVESGRVRVAIEALCEADTVGPVGGPNAVANPRHSAFLLAACSSPGTDAGSIVRATNETLSMLYECDYGKLASSDRRESRLPNEPSEKEKFGTQVAAVLSKVGARAEDCENTLADTTNVGITIGWVGDAHPMGSVHFDLSGGDVSFLYSDTPVFVDLHRGVTLKRFNFGFTNRLDLDPYAVRRFGRLMRDLYDIWSDERVCKDPGFLAARSSMRREGWGLFDSGNGRQTIQKLDDDPVRRFRTDQEALDHVKSMARLRSPLHSRAMRLHYTELNLENDSQMPRPQFGRCGTSDQED